MWSATERSSGPGRVLAYVLPTVCSITKPNITRISACWTAHCVWYCDTQWYCVLPCRHITYLCFPTVLYVLMCIFKFQNFCTSHSYNQEFHECPKLKSIVLIFNRLKHISRFLPSLSNSVNWDPYPCLHTLPPKLLQWHPVWPTEQSPGRTVTRPGHSC